MSSISPSTPNLQQVFVTVPEGMSYVNALRALYSAATPTPFLQIFPELEQKQAQCIATSQKMAELFKRGAINSTPPYYMDYIAGKKIKVHFHQFPRLDVTSYDEEYGKEAAQKALEAYSKIQSENRFDKGDSYDFKELKL